MKELSGMTYQEVAYEVMKLYLTDFTEEELKGCINKAYDKKFDTDIAALETERNAIKTEMDTLKSIAKDNVDRPFKLFS